MTAISSSSSSRDWKYGRHPLSHRKHGEGGHGEESWLVIKWERKKAARLSTSYVNTNSDCVAKNGSATPRAFAYRSRLTFHTKAARKTSPLPSHYLGEAVSPVKPLQCRSVTTHLFSQCSLASVSDCSLSRHNPAAAEMQGSASYTPCQGACWFYCLYMHWYEIFW